jgi:hypothetical protein
MRTVKATSMWQRGAASSTKLFTKLTKALRWDTLGLPVTRYNLLLAVTLLHVVRPFTQLSHSTSQGSGFVNIHIADMEMHRLSTATSGLNTGVGSLKAYVAVD